jgi:hypothetical protein
MIPALKVLMHGRYKTVSMGVLTVTTCNPAQQNTPRKGIEASAAASRKA